ncbi:MAG: glycosyltransferase [Rikenellaceae bacterium]|jgi:glycosyltransferase involved in cell wall biosynthesis|nr:glycosyltransferase [Rikenellaceae bacterium]
MNEKEPTTMRSALFVGTAHPYRGGLSFFNEMLTRIFNKRGIRSKIYTFTLQYPAFLFPGKTQYSATPAPEDVRIERRVNTINPLNWLRVGLLIRKRCPDALVVRYWLPLMAPCFGTICRLVRGNGHTRVLALLDNIVPHERRPGDRALTRYFVGGVDGFIYMSDQVKADLDRFTTTKPALFAPHPLFDVYGKAIGREQACAAIGLDPAMRYSLFFGYVRDYKGLDLLIKAWGEMKRQGTLGDRRLIVAGEYYGNREKYTALIHQNRVQNEVLVFDRFIPDEQVRFFFSVADLVIQPYKTATQSGVTQVAYHFGVPMIVTRVGGLAEIVPDGKTGYVVDTTPEAIAEAVERFYAEGRAEEFRRNIVEEKKRFSWEAMVDRFEELYRLTQED